MKVELRHLSSVCSDLDKGNVCPACPKVRLETSRFTISLVMVVMYRKEEHLFSQWTLFLVYQERKLPVLVIGILYMVNSSSVTRQLWMSM